MSLMLCFIIVTVSTVVSSDQTDHLSSSPSTSPYSKIKFQWFSPIQLNNVTESSQEYGNNFDTIVWPHFQQILYWLQRPEEKIHISRIIPHGVFLRQDLAVGYELKCVKATSEPYVFDNATIEFYECLKTYLNNGHADDNQSLSVDDACRDRRAPTKCMETWKTKMSSCFNTDELETLNSLQRIMEKMLSLSCENSGRNFVSIMSGEGYQCIRTQMESIRKCSKTSEQIVFPLQEDSLQFALNIGIRNQLNERRWCILSALKNCSDNTARDFYESVFSIVHGEIHITVPIWCIAFISFIICFALSFFFCVHFTSETEPTKRNSGRS